VDTINAIPNEKRKRIEKAMGMNKRVQDNLPPMSKIMMDRAMNERMLSINTPKQTLRGKINFGR
jgi:hypothetical protein